MTLPSLTADSTVSLDDRIVLINVLDSLRFARQVVYTEMKKSPHLDLQSTFDEAQATYVRFCAATGVEPQPVFDEEEHIRKRLRERDPDFLAVYGRDPKYVDVDARIEQDRLRRQRGRKPR